MHGFIESRSVLALFRALTVIATVSLTQVRADDSTVKKGNNASPEDRIIISKLDQPLTINFVDAPLEDILNYIRVATGASDGHSIDFYFDPNGLKAAKMKMTTRVSFASTEQSKLKTSLSSLLKPLALTYYIEKGRIIIDSTVSHKKSDKLERVGPSGKGT